MRTKGRDLWDSIFSYYIFDYKFSPHVYIHETVCLGWRIPIHIFVIDLGIGRSSCCSITSALKSSRLPPIYRIIYTAAACSPPVWIIDRMTRLNLSTASCLPLGKTCAICLCSVFVSALSILEFCAKSKSDHSLPCSPPELLCIDYCQILLSVKFST